MENNRFELFSTSVAHIVKTLQILKSHKMGQYDLKGTTCLCLCQLLASEEGLTAGELSACCGIDKAQVSRCMTELVGCGFVYRDDREGRRYRRKYLLTDEGSAAAHDISRATMRIQTLAEQGIEQNELDTFYRVLMQMCDNLSELREQLN